MVIPGINERISDPFNPWFQHWYMAKFQCKLPGVFYPPYSEFYPECATFNENQKRALFKQTEGVLPMIDGVFSLAQGLKKAHQIECEGEHGICKF